MIVQRAAGDRQRLRVEIHGAVQGVGFRPFVYRLATELALTGWVINDTQGVFIEVEGPTTALQHFLIRLPAEAPPRAIIQTMATSWLSPAGFARFEIRHSDNAGEKTVLVLPDIATCPNCLAEVFDEADRRHRYPFTNCTNCGPRFTIIEALPYDRPNTTMRRFVMCPHCRAEYENPLDRRFHAQPNACAVCGPKLTLWLAGDTSGSGSVASHAERQTSNVAQGEDALRGAVAALRAGRIVAVKGLGGFHLMVDARNGAAIRRLRESKPRRAKPFALMARDLAQVRQFCAVPAEAEALLTSPEAPIVLLPKLADQKADVPPDASRQQRIVVSSEVAPGNPCFGVMLPYTPLHHLLLRDLDFPVVATSGNLSDEPICTDEDEAMQRLAGIADVFLVHDRPIARHADDSVAWIVAGAPRLLRRARGYAPLPITLKEPIPTILAVGAHLKNTVALSVGRQAFISQHIGDLETPEAMAAFERVIADFLRLYEARPVAIAHDLHPEYLSTRWAHDQGSRESGVRSQESETRNQGDRSVSSGLPVLLPDPCPLISVQHHHAHLAACLAENQVDGPALGVTWDGTGYGTDGTIWGGEFLVGDAAGCERVAHLRPFRLPGGEAAVREPRRTALALLWELYGEAALEMDDLAPMRALRPEERRVLAQMLARGVNAPITTSAGRLFDGIAALIGLHQEVSFEGQAAMALEFAADAAEPGAYEIEVRSQGPGGRGQPVILDWAPLVVAVLTDLRRGVPQGIIAARFHNALIEGMAVVAQAVGQPAVALTGGCFQNRLLTERGAERLDRAGFQVLLHRQVPPNDGGISLGQLVIAAAQLAK